MPRYYFDVDDGADKLVDQEGTPLADHQAARLQALSMLPAIAKDTVPHTDQRVFSCQVRDEGGRPIFMATLSLAGEWLA